MTLANLLQPLVNGLMTGSIYILSALGLTVIFSIMQVLNFAHGEIYMIGAITVYFLCTLFHMNYLLAILIAMIVVGIIGIVLERFFFRPISDEDMLLSVIIATALTYIFQTSAQIIFGTSPMSMSEFLPGTLDYAGFHISVSRLAAAGLSLFLLVVMYLFVYKTRSGKAMQAMAQDRDAAALQGVDIDKIRPMGFAIGCILAGAAGGIMAPILYVDATMGTPILNKSLSIIMLGGIGSIPGAALGGIIIGVVEAYGQSFLGYTAATTIPFIIMILILLFKRTGLMGRQV